MNARIAVAMVALLGVVVPTFAPATRIQDDQLDHRTAVAEAGPATDVGALAESFVESSLTACRFAWSSTWIEADSSLATLFMVGATYRAEDNSLARHVGATIYICEPVLLCWLPRLATGHPPAT